MRKLIFIIVLVLAAGGARAGKANGAGKAPRNAPRAGSASA